MPQISVNPPGNEDVSFLLLALYEVVEVCPRVQHGRGPRALSHDQQSGAEDEPRCAQGWWKDAVCVSGEEMVVDEGFDEGQPVRDVVCFAVAGQEEGGDGGCGWVGEGGGVVFEVVEEGEEEQEEGEAPEWCWGWGGGGLVGGEEGAEVEGCEEGGGGCGAEGEGAEGYSGRVLVAVDGGGEVGRGGRGGVGAVGVEVGVSRVAV